MVVPVAVRSLAAVAGGALVITAWANVIGTLVVPRRGQLADTMDGPDREPGIHRGCESRQLPAA